jgi:hypothetical protein
VHPNIYFNPEEVNAHNARCRIQRNSNSNRV